MTYPTSPRETLLAAIATALSGISITNGYNTDAGTRVTREPAPVVGDEAGEFIAVVWGKQTTATDRNLARTHRYTVVQIVAKVPARLDEAQAKLDAITDDIEKAMRGYITTPGFLQPQYESAEPIVAKPGDAWIGVMLTYGSHIPVRTGDIV